jgi:spore germination protein GerM
MQDPNLRNSSVRPQAQRSLLAGLAAAVLLAGGGLAWWMQQATQAPKPEVINASPTDITQAPLQQSVQVYWLKPTAQSFELVPASVSVSAPGQPDALLKAALESMLKGSGSPDLTSTVPAGTALKQVEVKPDGVHVDLSQAFTTGGGSSSMTGRVGQVIYTATTLDSQAPVWISVEGKPLTVLGGEGLIIDQPMTRAAFKQNFPL